MNGAGVEEEQSENVQNLRYAARATNVQFRALRHHLRAERLSTSAATILESPHFRASSNFTATETSKWLRNAWNTEAVLRQQCALDEESKRFALQWAFSQAYYAAFCQILAFFATSGQTQRSHSAVLCRFGELVRENKYPKELSWFADGGMYDITITGLRKRFYPSPFYLELQDAESVETQISQFLNSTRKLALDERKEKCKFKTKTGQPRKNLNRDQWAGVSSGIGPTTVLNLLHRKRIKANYRDIDTFLHTEISGDTVLEGLIQIVDAVAMVHEALQRSVLTSDQWNHLMVDENERYPFLASRRGIITNAT